MPDPNLIWDNHRARIVALNLIAAVSIGQLSEQQARAICRWWAECVTQLGYRADKIVEPITLLNDYFEGRIPFPFTFPALILPDPHILDRRDGGLEQGERGAVVRRATQIHSWANTRDIENSLIDLSARNDQVGSQRLKKYAEKRWRLDVKQTKTITNPEAGSRAIMFYTKADAINGKIAEIEFEKRADTARDVLGLVHHGVGAPLVLVEFSSHLAEQRDDRGRPTIVDAGGGARFICLNPAAPPGRAWGWTADLSQMGDGLVGVGLPERVCGPFPLESHGAVQVSVRLLGFVKLPRGDVLGTLDEEFANALQSCCAAMEPAMDLRERLAQLMDWQDE